MTSHLVYSKSNTTGATSGARPAFPFGAHVVAPGFSRVRSLINI